MPVSLKVFVTRSGNLNNGGCLSAPDTLLLARYAYGTAADSDLHKVRACYLQGSRKPSRSTTFPAPTFTLSPYFAADKVYRLLPATAV